MGIAIDWANTRGSLIALFAGKYCTAIVNGPTVRLDLTDWENLLDEDGTQGRNYTVM